MDRNVIRKLPLGAETPLDSFVPGTPAERIAMVWPLTAETASLSKQYDPDKPMQRHVVKIRRRKVV
jgi:hypothetical protein